MFMEMRNFIFVSCLNIIDVYFSFLFFKLAKNLFYDEGYGRKKRFIVCKFYPFANSISLNNYIKKIYDIFFFFLFQVTNYIKY